MPPIDCADSLQTFGSAIQRGIQFKTELQWAHKLRPMFDAGVTAHDRGVWTERSVSGSQECYQGLKATHQPRIGDCER